jgi:hypothetical protein
LEALDLVITKGMLEAEDQCRIHHRQPWTREVNEVMTTANILRINRTPAIRNLPLRVTPIFANKNHALNTLKMGPLLRNSVMLP